jgi:hypothetical protein
MGTDRRMTEEEAKDMAEWRRWIKAKCRAQETKRLTIARRREQQEAK